MKTIDTLAKKWDVVIGLEVHVQLSSNTKMFTPSSWSYGESPNTQICPITLGYPGTLPTINIEAVKKVLNSEYLTQGPVVPEFENLFKKFCRTKNAIAFNSATSALHVACLSLKVGPGDLVWTSAITFVASANCAV